MAPPQHPSSTRSNRRDAPGFVPGTGRIGRLDVAVFSVLLILCGACFLTLEVNPYTIDGWLETRGRILENDPGGDNYTPIAAPALAYAGIYVLRAAAGGSLVHDFYLAALAHQVMLLLSGLLVYGALRLLHLARTGAIAAVLFVLVVESTYVTQGIWSENVMLLLVTFFTFLVLYLYFRPELPDKQFGQVSVVAGSTLGLAVLTRVLPIVLLGAAAALLWSNQLWSNQLRSDQRARVWRFAGLNLGIVAVFLIASASANYMRFGRFELTNSTGRHLWQGTTTQADALFGDLDGYQELKQVDPNVAGKMWWEIATDAPAADLEFSLRRFVVEGIVRHPIVFLGNGLAKCWSTIGRGPSVFGLTMSGARGPLERDTLLPPVAGTGRTAHAVLDPIGSLTYQIFPVVLWGALILGVASIGIGWRRRRRAGLPGLDRFSSIWLFCAVSYLGGTCLAWILEQPEPRYVLPYLGLLAIFASISLHLMRTTFMAKDSLAEGK